MNDDFVSCNCGQHRTTRAPATGDKSIPREIGARYNIVIIIYKPAAECDWSPQPQLPPPQVN